MFNRIPLFIGAMAIALASFPATSAQAQSEQKRCTKVLFVKVCAPSLSGSPSVSKRVHRDSDENSGQFVKRQTRAVEAVRSESEEQPDEKQSQADRRAQAIADERARAEDAAVKAREAEERARAAEDRAETYKEKYERRRDRAKEVPSDHNLAAEAEWAEKYEQVQGTADKARDKADLKADIAERAAESQSEKDSGGEETSDDQGQDDGDYQESI